MTSKSPPLLTFDDVNGRDQTERLADEGLPNTRLITPLLDIPHHVVNLVLLVGLLLILKLPNILLETCQYSVLSFKVGPSYLAEFGKV